MCCSDTPGTSQRSWYPSPSSTHLSQQTSRTCWQRRYLFCPLTISAIHPTQLYHHRLCWTTINSPLQDSADTTQLPWQPWLETFTWVPTTEYSTEESHTIEWLMRESTSSCHYIQWKAHPKMKQVSRTLSLVVKAHRKKFKLQRKSEEGSKEVILILFCCLNDC